ncbi:hypothetical protein AVDCRST_MAG84-517 [uncultured Microcoleus sp.]|uniref:Uncharacterized protein n=1 Tax=uncultured Microcoleus sp. TaxID=259945 RepID=A0A6J4KK15_9CYAN|nr:hypothetical protein AVDCRST_MAG84-517 [uncultured Microcoleus sp.]
MSASSTSIACVIGNPIAHPPQLRQITAPTPPRSRILPIYRSHATESLTTNKPKSLKLKKDT